MPKVTIKQANEMGIPPKSIQTILFNKHEWIVPTARKWLEKHNFKSNDWRKTANEIRFLQNPDIRGAKYYSKTIGNGSIILVFQDYS